MTDQVGWKYRQKRRRGIKIYERNNQWSEVGRMEGRKRKKIKNLQERERKRQGKIMKNTNKQTNKQKKIKKNRIGFKKKKKQIDKLKKKYEG